MILVLVLTGCQTHNDNANADTNVSTPDELVTNERYPSFVVETVEAKKGAKDVIVNISLSNNPGFLTMAMNISYDDTNMSLVDVTNGKDYEYYNFVGPKNMQSGCVASWFATEMPETIVDGDILELHFEINENAQSGSYPISILRPENGGIVDEYKESIIFNNAIGYINIK